MDDERTKIFRTLQRSFAAGLCLSLGLILAPIGGHADDSSDRFYANQMQEAAGTFSGVVELKAQSTPTQSQIRQGVLKQLFWALYPLESTQYAMPLSTFKLSNVQITPKEGTPGIYVVSYECSAKFVVRKGVGGPLRMVVVRNIDDALGKILVNGGNLCGGESTRDAAWVYWNPATSGCPLVQGTDYSMTSVPLTLLANTQQTYPEYPRLLDPQGNIKATMLLGDGNSSYAFEQFAGLFPDYERRDWTEEEIRQVVQGEIPTLPMVADFTKQVGSRTILLRLVLGDSGFSHGASKRAFQFFWRQALEQFSIIGYMGHAGYSHNLSLKEIEAAQAFQIQFKTGYQILDINACLPNFYYAEQYYDRKRSLADPQGTRDMDLLTPDIIGYFGYTGTAKLVRAAEAWLSGQRVMSYQEILRDNSIQSETVTGDEDNPTVAPATP